MKISKLQEGRFLRRYKRFFADVEFNGQVHVAHVANSGSLKTVLSENARCLVSPAENPERKLRWSLEFVEVNGAWVGVNTSWPNKLVAEAAPNLWPKFTWLKPEIKISKETRLDLLLSSKEITSEVTKALLTPKKCAKNFYKDLHFVEVKSVSMAHGELALFPDSVTARGQKHLNELLALKELGASVELVFVVQRSDCKTFAPADEIDPEYGKLLRQSVKVGLKVSAYPIEIVATLAGTSLKLSLHSLEIRL